MFVIIIMCSCLPLPCLARCQRLSRAFHFNESASISVLRFLKLRFSVSSVLSSIELYLLIHPLLHAFSPFILLIIVQFLNSLRLPNGTHHRNKAKCTHPSTMIIMIHWKPGEWNGNILVLHHHSADWHIRCSTTSPADPGRFQRCIAWCWRQHRSFWINSSKSHRSLCTFAHGTTN